MSRDGSRREIRAQGTRGSDRATARALIRCSVKMILFDSRPPNVSHFPPVSWRRLPISTDWGWHNTLISPDVPCLLPYCISCFLTAFVRELEKDKDTSLPEPCVSQAAPSHSRLSFQPLASIPEFTPRLSDALFYFIPPTSFRPSINALSFCGLSLYCLHLRSSSARQRPSFTCAHKSPC